MSAKIISFNFKRAQHDWNTFVTKVNKQLGAKMPAAKVAFKDLPENDYSAVTIWAQLKEYQWQLEKKGYRIEDR